MIVFISFLYLAAVAARPQEMGEEVFAAEGDCIVKFPSITRGNVIRNIIFFDSVVDLSPTVESLSQWWKF